LRGQTIDAEIDENLELRRIDESESALWSLLLFSGYLTVDGVTHKPHTTLHHLRTPNEEVHRIYRKTFKRLLTRKAGGELKDLLSGMLEGDAMLLQQELEKILITIASYHDFAGKTPEAVYHAFVMGLIAHLSGTHIIRSNRESGHGRADLMVIPKKAGEPAAVLELKVVRDKDNLPKDWLSALPDFVQDRRVEYLLKRGLVLATKQIKDRNYTAELADHDVGPVYRFAVAFHKKRCLVERV
jgi:hypothetical protein